MWYLSRCKTFLHLSTLSSCPAGPQDEIYFTILCGPGESVTRGKPEPDIYLFAASTFSDKPAPARCLVFEDAPVGVTAGLRAGMYVLQPSLPFAHPPSLAHNWIHVKNHNINPLCPQKNPEPCRASHVTAASQPSAPVLRLPATAL